MYVSFFDLFKVGLGPSSSHTMGPLSAAQAFLSLLCSRGEVGSVRRIKATLMGSLAWTGKGHGSDRAIQLGYCRCDPATVDVDQIDGVIEALRTNGIALKDHRVAFSPDEDIEFDLESDPGRHPNALSFSAFNGNCDAVCRRVYYSVGGGFVVDENGAPVGSGHSVLDAPGDRDVPFAFSSMRELLALGQERGMSVAEMVAANECHLRGAFELDRGIEKIHSAMRACISRGLTAATGVLPGGLKVPRRAPGLCVALSGPRGPSARPDTGLMDFPNLYAIAVSEENAAGGRVVTAPTNGAAGVLPAVLVWLEDHYMPAGELDRHAFFLTATAVGGLCKRNASISGAEVGCQGEVGVAAAMAAAGTAAALGGTGSQIENAAEVAMEHHLGMTCDPVGGLVQIPCIERNAMGAVKAINAALLALKGDGRHHISLDRVVETMLRTGQDMSSAYKETSRGGLAVSFADC